MFHAAILSLCLCTQTDLQPLLTFGTDYNQYSYDQAYTLSPLTEQPMIILVGAEWCPGCVVMKKRMKKILTELTTEYTRDNIGNIPNSVKSKLTFPVLYVEIDSDKDPELARKILTGNSIPQLVVYIPQPDDKWVCRTYKNVQSEEATKAILRKAIEQ